MTHLPETISLWCQSAQGSVCDLEPMSATLSSPTVLRGIHSDTQEMIHGALGSFAIFATTRCASLRVSGLFRRELLMRVASAGDGLAGRFHFVLRFRTQYSSSISSYDY